VVICLLIGGWYEWVNIGVAVSKKTNLTYFSGEETWLKKKDDKTLKALLVCVYAIRKVLLGQHSEKYQN